jgi:hypothetical protein
VQRLTIQSGKGSCQSLELSLVGNISPVIREAKMPKPGDFGRLRSSSVLVLVIVRRSNGDRAISNSKRDIE